MTGKITGNLSTHIRQAHKGTPMAISFAKKFDECKKTQKEKTPKTSKKAAVNITPYDPCYQAITRKLAIYVGANGVPNSTIKNPDFKAFVQEMDPKYPIPGTASLGKAIDMLYLEMKTKIESCLLNTKSISLCTDVWTKKGICMTSSYLGVTAHFFPLAICRVPL